MNKILTLTLAASAAALTLQAQAQPQGQEMGRVLSATPVTQQVAVPQQLCSNETVYSNPRPSSGAGAIIGAIAGGVLGHTVGGGTGQALATGVGAIGGAMVGDHLESGQSGPQNVQRCTTQMRYDNQVVGYDVVYEYAGRRYSVRTQADPGQWIPVTVQPAAQVPVTPAPAATYPQGYSYYSPPRPPVVMARTPVYVMPPISATIGYRSGNGWYRGGYHY